MIQLPTQTLINGLQARKLGLTLRVTSDLYKKGTLKLRCSATLLITYQFEASKTITAGGSQISSSSMSFPSSPSDPDSFEPGGVNDGEMTFRFPPRWLLSRKKWQMNNLLLSHTSFLLGFPFCSVLFLLLRSFRSTSSWSSCHYRGKVQVQDWRLDPSQLFNLRWRCPPQVVHKRQRCKFFCNFVSFVVLSDWYAILLSLVVWTKRPLDVFRLIELIFCMWIIISPFITVRHSVCLLFSASFNWTICEHTFTHTLWSNLRFLLNRLVHFKRKSTCHCPKDQQMDGL